MKFSSVLQLSSLAVAIASGAVSAKEEPHLLRGGPVVASDVVVKAGKSSSSKSGSSRSSSKSNKSGSSSRSSSKSSKDFAAANIAVASSKSSKDSSSRSSSSSSSKSSKDFASVIESEDVDVEIPEFFPSEMTEEQLASFIEERKKRAAQKRQEQRDARRERDNPDRSQREENQERARKTKQSARRNDPNVDPYYDSGSGDDWGARREAKRIVGCEQRGVSCRYSGPNSRCYNDCVGPGTRSTQNQACSQRCRFIETGCYEDCRRYDRATVCLNDCGVNVDADLDDRARDSRYRIYSGSDSCLDDCDERYRDNRSRERCFERCYSNDQGDYYYQDNEEETA